MPWGAGGKGLLPLQDERALMLGRHGQKGLRKTGTEHPLNTRDASKGGKDRFRVISHQANGLRAGARGSITEPRPSCSWGPQSCPREHSCRGI